LVDDSRCGTIPFPLYRDFPGAKKATERCERNIKCDQKISPIEIILHSLLKIEKIIF
jgi:hypothetical protein